MIIMLMSSSVAVTKPLSEIHHNICSKSYYSNLFSAQNSESDNLKKLK